MKVLFLGVGADTTNCSPTPPVLEDGRFEYIPIPESEGQEGTTESKTYGNTELRHDSGFLADYLEKIRPGGEQGEWLSGDDISDWPLHYDPNFDALTYGESYSRADYVNKIRSLERGDVVAFYTGLQRRSSTPRHRYLIGYMTVQSILDLRRINQQGREASFSDLSTDDQTRLMNKHSENAHAKRFLASGSLKAENDGVVIVDSKEPGGRLERAIRISEYPGRGHHYLSDDMKSKLWPNSPETYSNDFYLGGRKKAHLFDVSSDRFHQIVS